jgi:thiol-disulfide isomerase/thioredoxin
MRAWVLSLSGIFLFLPSAYAGHKKPDTAAVQKLLAQGDVLFGQNKFGEAFRLYKRADRLSDHTCVECELDVARVYEMADDFPAALKETDRALKAAGTNTALEIQVHTARGVLLARMADSWNDRKFKEAEAEFRQVLELNPKAAMAKYNLGIVLLRQKRDAEGVAELKAYLADPNVNGNAQTAAEARRLIAEPERAREPFLPDFSVTDLDGQTISNGSLQGKVALLDFWGTWCPPCRNAVPMLLDLKKKYAGKPVEFIGISSDTNRQVWEKFIAKNHMDWPEYLDLSRQLQTLFEIEGFPTFIVVDRQGVMSWRRSGYGVFTEAQLDDAIGKALRKKSGP